METIWATIITGIFTFISGLLMICLFRKKNKILTEFQKEVDFNRAELDAKNKEIQAQLDTKLELLKIKENQLYKERLDAIREIYCIINSFLTQARDIIKLQQRQNKDYRKFHETFRKFELEWSKCKIFFSESISHKIEDLVFNIYIDIMGTVSDDITESYEFKCKELTSEELKKLTTEVTETFPSIMKEIASNFRQIIGVE